jgi:hypothetical protein
VKSAERNAAADRPRDTRFFELQRLARMSRLLSVVFGQRTAYLTVEDRGRKEG